MMLQSALMLLLACICTAVVEARLHDWDAAAGATAMTGARRLLQTECSKWCAPDSCLLDRTTGRPACRKCQNQMVTVKTGPDAGLCGCPAGRYFFKSVASPDNTATCMDCNIGKYCSSRLFAVPNSGVVAPTLGERSCPAGMTTRQKRATSVRQCVLMPGYYNAGTRDAPQPLACPADTFNAGYNLASQCTPCPSGFTTKATSVDAGVGSTASSSCRIRPGYFLSGPGQVLPCSQSSFQAAHLSTNATSTVCTICPEGVTTAGVGSTSASDCNRLLPGYYASGTASSGDLQGALIATLCPQGYYCPGSSSADTAAATQVTFGSVTTSGAGVGLRAPPASFSASAQDAARVFTCASAHGDIAHLWTRGLGSTSADECFVPPGMEVRSGMVQECQSGSYQDQWLTPSSSASCTSCGEQIASDATALLQVYTVESGANDNVTESSITVRGSSESCYMDQGWGMSKTNSGAFKAQKCNLNNYGASAKAYGLAINPCKNCPVGTESLQITWTDETVKSVNGVEVAIRDGAGDTLYIHPLSCVTLPGYGYDGRSASPCSQGSWNTGGNLALCTQCAYGLTTADTWSAATHDDEQDCKVARGFGYDATSRRVAPCPRGYFNDEVKDDTVSACKLCSAANGASNNSYTSEPGASAASDCSVCAPGFGGASASSCADCATASTPGYGPQQREDTQCIACPTQTAGYTFFYKGVRKAFTSPPVVRSAATSAADCVSKFAQIEDALWFLAGAATSRTANRITDCAAACGADCMFFTWEYTGATGDADAGTCLLALSADDATDKLTAFKAVPAGDVGALSVKAVSTGLYTQWRHDGSTIGTQEEIITSGALDKTKAFEACDDDIACAGVYCTMADPSSDDMGLGGRCWKIKGVSGPQGAHAAKRSLTQAIPARLLNAVLVRQTCQSVGYVCTTGDRRDNTVVPAGASGSDSLCCDPAYAAQVTSLLNLQSTCTASAVQQFAAGMLTDLRAALSPSDAAKIRATGTCQANGSLYGTATLVVELANPVGTQAQLTEASKVLVTALGGDATSAASISDVVTMLGTLADADNFRRAISVNLLNAGFITVRVTGTFSASQVQV